MAATQTVTGTMSVANTVNDQISGGNYLSSNSPAKPARQLSDPNHNCLQELKDALLPKMIEVDQTVTSEKATDNIIAYLLTLVCKQWRTILNQPCFWRSVAPILHKRDLYEDGIDGSKEFTSLTTFELREFESVCLVSVSDMDICEFIDHCPKTKRTLKAISLRRSTVTDAGLEVMLEQLGAVSSLELSGCNDFTEAGLWASLQPRLVSLSISDCINVADESVAAIAQRLPNLQELNFQAYHVTDGVLGCLVALRGGSLSVLRLKSCWELTNQAVVNLVHCLPQLTTLSLSGCSKITDEGVEMIAANMGKLVSLDLSWCPRITDAALEYVACDLSKLEELTLDR
ncbi:putative F-box/LRR-repeat protein 16 isoform X2 [Apostichopus japonicus]|uniref:Putative F-box/LRR-repeat protein 16 isoform X2 n=1 Tax=Stichopus japonicus TaxID=307972 RepID=A0A2G8JFJ3_STIJA|nr:putative F-box/LRR-repeat protein 16 isoform X2 [Apostichopus japonicus]